MRARIIDYLYVTPRKQRLLLELADDFRSAFDELKGADVEISVKRYRAPRSLDANAYLWVLCGKIAEKIGVSKEDIYRNEIREMGIYTPLPIREDAVGEFARIWCMHGIGWFVDIVDNSKLKGYKLIHAYAGSSTYNTAEFSRLLDGLIAQAKSLGIEVRPEEEIKSMLEGIKNA